MTTATPVEMDEDLTEAPTELTPEQIEVLAAVEELALKGRDADAIVPPDCEFDGPGDDDDEEEEEGDDDL